LKNRKGKNDKVSWQVWEIIETEAKKVRVVKVKRRRSKEVKKREGVNQRRKKQ